MLLQCKLCKSLRGENVDVNFLKNYNVKAKDAVDHAKKHSRQMQSSFTSSGSAEEIFAQCFVDYTSGGNLMEYKSDPLQLSTTPDQRNNCETR